MTTPERAELLNLAIKCSSAAHIALAERDLTAADGWIAAGSEILRQYEELPDRPRCS